MAAAELGFKKQLTREEKFEKKKQRLAAIGNAFESNNFTYLTLEQLELLVLPKI